jgi:membrane protein
MSSRVRQASSSFVGLISETYGEWRMHRTIRLGAGLAYYGLFAFVPVLAVSLSLAGFFFQRQDVQEYLAGQLADILGDDAAAASSALAGVLDEFDSLLSFGVVGAVSLVLTASLLVLALQDALNTIWERPVRSGLRTTVARRALAFLVVVGAGGVLMVSFALNAVSALFGRMVPDVAVMESVGELIGTAGSWALGVGVIALLFRYLTDVRVPWRGVLPGAAVTALLVAVGTVAIGAYLRRYAATSLLGATGSVFLVLIWIYYEAQIILAGAEFTRTLARRGIDPIWPASLDDDRQPGTLPGDDAAVDIGR